MYELKRNFAHILRTPPNFSEAAFQHPNLNLLDSRSYCFFTALRIPGKSKQRTNGHVTNGPVNAS